MVDRTLDMRRRLMLLLPTNTYHAEDFVAAAERLDIDLVVASEEPSTMEPTRPANLLTLDFRNPEVAASQAAEFAERHPVEAVLAVDDSTLLAGAAVAEALGVPCNSLAATRETRNKHLMREALALAGLPGPGYQLFDMDEDPASHPTLVLPFPVVLKPTVLAGSQGVIRADDVGSFTAAFARIAELLRRPEIAQIGSEARQILVEGFVPGREVAVEGLLDDGELRVLAVFDKPDPLDGPYFEETIYVTPSRMPDHVGEQVRRATAGAARALGLRTGPVHAELRLSPRGPIVIEIAPRTIGGLCSRTLRFGTGMTLEELVLRQALGLPTDRAERESAAAGVMMIPIPHAGRLVRVDGIEDAQAHPSIEAVTITIAPTQPVEPLPDGNRYLGFIFARAETPGEVEEALRDAHAMLEIVIDAARAASS